MLLKEVPGVLPVLENSDLSLSKLWHKDVNQVLPVQLTALILKTLREVPDSQIELEVKYLIKQINYAVEMGLIETPQIASYSGPQRSALLLSTLINGLQKMSYERRRAVLFSLESDLPITQVEHMTVEQAYRMRAQLSPMAKEIIDTAILSVQTSYMFWENVQGHRPLTSLEQEVHDAFGMNSYQLYSHYAKINFDEVRAKI